MSTTTAHQKLAITADAARNAIAQIAALDADDLEDLENYHGAASGFPISLEVELDDEGAVESITVNPGHYDYAEWHTIPGLLEMIRSGDIDQARTAITDSIRIAIDNEREAQAQIAADN